MKVLYAFHSHVGERKHRDLLVCTEDDIATRQEGKGQGRGIRCFHLISSTYFSRPGPSDHRLLRSRQCCKTSYLRVSNKAW